MSLSPKKFREIVFQALFSEDFFACDEKEMVSFLMEKLKVTRKYVKEALAKMQLIHSKRVSINRKIKHYSTEYRLERISKVELNILRLGVYELLYEEAIPYKVVISEAVRLCNKFSTPHGAKFVNGILDAVYKELIAKKNDREK